MINIMKDIINTPDSLLPVVESSPISESEDKPGAFSPTLILYENTVLNKILITFNNFFSSIDERSVIGFDMIEKDSLHKFIVSLAQIPENVYIIFNTNTKYNTDEYLPYELHLIIKDQTDSEIENVICENWYIYWRDSVQNAINYEISPDLLSSIYNYYFKSPNMSAKNVVAFVDSIKSYNREDFINNIKHNLHEINMRGKRYLDTKNHIFEECRIKSKNCLIDNKRYTICFTQLPDIELGYYLLSKTNSEVVMMITMNLKLNKLSLKLMPYSKSKNIMFSDLITDIFGNIGSCYLDINQNLDLIKSIIEF